MPIKLQVIRDGAEGSDPADYLYEQDRITIGRGSGNDLTLPDQKVSTNHAEIRARGGQYVLFDRGSKNHTFVHGNRVGEDEGYVLSSGDVFSVGDFQVEFVPLFMPSSEQTAFADPQEDANPFEKSASQLSRALQGFIETYSYLPANKRDDTLEEALKKHLGDDPEVIGEHAVVQYLSERLHPEDPSSASAEPEPSSDDSAVDSVLNVLLRSAARMVSIPTHFWREFSGDTVVHPPDRAFIHKADLGSLRNHLLDPALSNAERAERLDRVQEAVDTLVAHNVAMLAAYKKAVSEGANEVLDQVNPSDVGPKEGGSFRSFFGSSDENEPLERLRKTWSDVRRMDDSKREQRFFRPSYVEEYLNRMAEAWDVDKDDIVEETNS